MSEDIEEILGAEIERVRVPPGMRPGEADEVRYVSFEPNENPGDVFEAVVWKISPPIAKEGGVILDGCILKTPDGKLFYATSFNGDVDGWRLQIESGAVASGRSSAKWDDEDFVVSDGSKYKFSDCVFEYTE